MIPYTRDNSEAMSTRSPQEARPGSPLWGPLSAMCLLFDVYTSRHLVQLSISVFRRVGCLFRPVEQKHPSLFVRAVPACSSAQRPVYIDSGVVAQMNMHRSLSSVSSRRHWLPRVGSSRLRVWSAGLTGRKSLFLSLQLGISAFPLNQCIEARIHVAKICLFLESVSALYQFRSVLSSSLAGQ
jgi:hypothetical protein